MFPKCVKKKKLMIEICYPSLPQIFPGKCFLGRPLTCILTGKILEKNKGYETKNRK
jgi:hypothetical protein